jgi:hypothetical protein
MVSLTPKQVRPTDQLATVEAIGRVLVTYVADVPVPFRFRQSRKTGGRRPSMTTAHGAGQTLDRRHRPCRAPATPDNFTIFEGRAD